MKRNVFFDIDGVLVDSFHEDPERCWMKAIDTDFGIDKKAFRKIFWGETMGEIVCGNILLADALAQHLPQMGYTGSIQAFIHYWMQHDSPVNNNAMRAIQTLHSSGQVNLYLATNQEKIRAQHLWEKTPFHQYFKGMYYSANMGIMKPNPAYFKYIEADLNLDVKKMPPIFFDDKPANIKAALSCGWEAFQYTQVNDLEKSDYIKAILTAHASSM